MCGCFGFIITAVAIFLSWKLGHPMAMKIAIGSAVANFWVIGIGHNYQRDPEAMPAFWFFVHLLAYVVAAAVIVYNILAAIP